MGLFESSRVTHFFHRRVLGSISPGLILTASSTMVQSGWQSDGSPLSSAVESRHNLVCGRSKDRNHDAVMRIGSEAPKRRTHSSNRHESQGTCRESATSNRHRYPITSVRTGPKLSGYPQRPPIIVPDAKRRRAHRHATRTATERSVACVPRPRSWACEHRERSPCELDTSAPRRSPSGTLEIATPIAPCLAELDHSRNGLTLSPGVFCRSRRV